MSFKFFPEFMDMTPTIVQGRDRATVSRLESLRGFSNAWVCQQFVLKRPFQTLKLDQKQN